MLCRKCGERPACPKQLAHQKYRCGECARAYFRQYNASPAGRARFARYAKTEKRRAAQRRRNKQKIEIRGRYVGMAASVEHAAHINAHIEERLHAFVAQQNGHVNVDE